MITLCQKCEKERAEVQLYLSNLSICISCYKEMCDEEGRSIPGRNQDDAKESDNA